MSYYDTSYPPSVLGLPPSHDLKLVGTVTPGTLEVVYTWDADGKPSTIYFGDGTSASTTNETATHVYAVGAVYTATVQSGSAHDSADIDIAPVADESPASESDVGVTEDVEGA